MSNDYNEPETLKTLSTDYTIESIKGTSDSLAYGLYCKLNDYEYHYNLVQNKYKTLASTWFFSSFIGIGYLISGHEVGIPVNVLIGIIILCLLASEGIFLLWFLDTGVYHKLIGAIFAEHIKLEENHPFLGSAHKNMLKLQYQKKRHPIFSHGIYYSSFIIFLLIISALSACMYFYKIGENYLFLVMLLFSIAAALFIYINKRHMRLYNDSYVLRKKRNKKK